MEIADPLWWVAKVVQYWYILAIAILVSNLTYGRENRKKYKRWDKIRRKRQYESSLKWDRVGKRRKRRRGIWRIFN